MHMYEYVHTYIRFYMPAIAAAPAVCNVLVCGCLSATRMPATSCCCCCCDRDDAANVHLQALIAVITAAIR